MAVFISFVELILPVSTSTLTEGNGQATSLTTVSSVGRSVHRATGSSSAASVILGKAVSQYTDSLRVYAPDNKYRIFLSESRNVVLTSNSRNHLLVSESRTHLLVSPSRTNSYITESRIGT